MRMKFIVIGSNSFSGSHFVDFLLDKGHSVLGTSRNKNVDTEFLPYTKNQSKEKSFEFFQMNINYNVDSFVDKLERLQPDYIVNFAAQGMVGESWMNPLDWYRTNILGQVALFEKLRALTGLKKYVHITTPEVYGNTTDWVNENWNFRPSTPYAVSRATGDYHLRCLFEAYNFPVVFTRSANVYGPGQQLYRIIPKTMMKARLGETLTLDGGGNSLRCFVHIHDVVRAIYKVAIHGSIGATYHISSDTPVRIIELVKMIAQTVDKSFSDLVTEGPDRAGKDQQYLLNSTRIRDELDWRDEISLAAGLEDTLTWIDANFAKFSKLPLEYLHQP